MKTFLLLAATVLLASCDKLEYNKLEGSQPKTYYVSDKGDDRNTGQGPDIAFRTIDRVNRLELHPYDSILFMSGQTFTGTLDLHTNDDPSNLPVVVSGWHGKAILEAKGGTGIIANDFPGLHVENMIIQASGVNNGTGIEIRSSHRTQRLAKIQVSHVEVKGFGYHGIWFRGIGDQGVIGAVVENSYVHDIGGVGIYASSEDLARLPHQDITVRYSKVERVKGDNKLHWSGTGISLSGVKGGLLAHNTVSDNGKEATDRGGYGIRIAECYAVNVVGNESFNNHKGYGEGGGGFIIDGGALQDTLRNNISYGNEGPGYMLREEGSTNPGGNNSLTGNSSTHDAYGISLWVTPARTLDNATFTNNKVVNSTYGVYFQPYAGGYKNVRFVSNTFSVPQVSNAAPHGVSFQ